VRLLATILVLAVSASAQIVKLTAGGSSIDSGYGAQALLYFSQSTALASGGCLNDRCGFSVADSFKIDGAKVTLGDSEFRFAQDSSELLVENRGVAITRGNVTAFAGATGADYQLPYLRFTDAKHFGIGTAYKRTLEAWRLQGIAAVSGSEKTAIESVAYSGEHLRFSELAGVLANRPTFDGSVAVKFTSFNARASHENYTWQGATGLADSASVAARASVLQFSASAFRSSFETHNVTGFAAHAGIVTRNWRVEQLVTRSGSQLLLMTSASEKVSHHLTLTATVNGKSPALGFEYVQNRITVSLAHSIDFTPLGFRQVTTVALSVHVPHTGVVAHLGANRIDGDKLRTSAWGSDYVTGPIKSTARIAGRRQKTNSGKYTVAGHVRDRAGRGVDGAAIGVGKALVFTDVTGAFFVRTNNAKPQPLHIATDDFQTHGRWVVVSAPETATAGTEVLIVVTAQ
jgi:hypothetical protein